MIPSETLDSRQHTEDYTGASSSSKGRGAMNQLPGPVAFVMGGGGSFGAVQVGMV